MKLLNYLVICVAFYEVAGGTKRNCGNMLVQVLETICTGSYNKIPTKKSVYNALDAMNMYSDIEGDDHLPFPSNQFLDDVLKGGHDNTFAKTRRRREFLGIYEECCVKGCSFNELASYCD